MGAELSACRCGDVWWGGLLQHEETSCPASGPLLLLSDQPHGGLAGKGSSDPGPSGDVQCEAQPGYRAQPAGASLVSRLPGAALAGCAPDPLNLAPSKAQRGSMFLLGPVTTFL